MATQFHLFLFASGFWLNRLINRVVRRARLARLARLAKAGQTLQLIPKFEHFEAARLPI